MKTEDRRMVITLKGVPEDLPMDQILNGTKMDIMVVKSPKNGTVILDHNTCDACDVEDCPENKGLIVIDEPHRNAIVNMTVGLDANVADGAEFIYTKLEPGDANEFVAIHEMNRAVANKIGRALSEGDNVYAMNNLLSYITQMVYHVNHQTKAQLYHVIGDCK